MSSSPSGATPARWLQVGFPRRLAIPAVSLSGHVRWYYLPVRFCRHRRKDVLVTFPPCARCIAMLFRDDGPQLWPPLRAVQYTSSRTRSSTSQSTSRAPQLSWTSRSLSRADVASQRQPGSLAMARLGGWIYSHPCVFRNTFEACTRLDLPAAHKL